MQSHFRILLLILLGTKLTFVNAGEPLRVDLSAATGRSDAETFAWHEWEVKEASHANKQFDNVTITLRPSFGEVSGFLHKAGLATGASLAADGVTSSSPLEIVLEGLSPGRHTLVTHHNSVKDKPISELQLSIGDATSRTKATFHASENQAVAANYLEFEVQQGVPVVATLRTLSDGSGSSGVVLNALEIDGNDPRHKAINLLPQNFDEHANGESGSIELAWQAPASAKNFHVYLAHDREWNQARKRVRTASGKSPEFLRETDQPTLSIDLDPHDSLRHYCWRVDAIDDEGNVTRGDVWSFRVRHLAFPGAEGYGRFAIGGRGGQVLKVTNLNDSGPGSLRAAIEASGPRTIVFDVSGRIHLKSRLAIRDDYITIAGQTAPGKGICISNYNLGMLGAHDNIVRFLRVRPGDTSGETLDGMGMASSDHSIVDHCSISWSHDEAFSSRGAKNITLQRTLISEALNIAGHRKYEEGKAHGFAASIGGDIGTFHHNLLAHCAGRNWSLAGGIDQANVHAGRLDIRNNVVYNWDYRTTDGGARLVQFVANYYKPGPATNLMTYLNPTYENPSFGPQQYYVEGNIVEGVVRPEGPVGPLKGVRVRGSQPWPVTFDEPFFPSYVHTQTAAKAYRDVLADVGCNVPALDEHDQRIIAETRNATATYEGSHSHKPGLPDSQDDVGGWEDYPELHRPEDWDTDGDGMPSAWEEAQGFDPHNAADGSQDANGDGYTNLEEYLNELVKSTARTSP